ncbi:hypothetical protein ACFLFF_30315 [Brevibacillus reuszeri]|uniref:hypothetical protein n=1 Tax=Brevibacillus reuszeri TaxID=54915 RepID=UPI00366DC069
MEQIEQIDQDRFKKDLETLINVLNESDNLRLVEQVMQSALSSYSINKYIHIQVQMFDIVGESAPFLMHFIKTPFNIEYHGRNKEVFKRLYNIKRLVGNHFRNIDNMITTPNRLNGAMFSFNDLYPQDISMVLMKNDGSNFTTEFDLNMGMNLTSQMLENLFNKLDRGHNNIDENLYMELLRKFDEFHSKMEGIRSQLVENIKN